MARLVLILGFASGLLLCPGMVYAKREAPKPVKPVVAGGMEYRAVHDRFAEGGQPAGIRAAVEARDAASGKVLWSARLYEIRYDLNLETDIQDVYVTTLRVEKGELHVTTENKNESFVVNLETHEVRKVVPATPDKK